MTISSTRYMCFRIIFNITVAQNIIIVETLAYCTITKTIMLACRIFDF